MGTRTAWLSWLAIAGLVLLVATACQPVEDAEDAIEESSETLVSAEQPPRAARGVALSPRSYEGSDLPDFLAIVEGNVDVLMHAGDWRELADETSAFQVLAELASAQDTEVMIVLSPSNGTKLLRPLDEPTIGSYLASLEAFVTEHQPRYLALGNELNLVESRDQVEYEQIVALWDRALPIVREHSPDTAVFVTFQYEWLIGQRGGWFGRTNDATNAQWNLLGDFKGADAIGITTYPGLVAETVADLGADYYEQIATHTELPVIISEAGWSANPDQQQRPGSEAEQVEFIEFLHAQESRLDLEATLWSFVFSTQIVEPAFTDMGLWRDDGTERPAWAAWIDTEGPAAPSGGAAGDHLVEPVGFSGFEEDWTVSFPGQLPLTAAADTAGRPAVYVAAKNGGVSFIDSEEGVVVATIDTGELGGHHAMHLVQQGTILVVALGDFFAPSATAGLAVIDVAIANQPHVLGVWQSAEPLHGAADVVVEAEVAYLAAMEDGVIAIDISDPTTPTPIATFRPDPNYPRPNPNPLALPNARGLAIAGDRLYVAYDAGGLRILDIDDPANMTEIGRHHNPDATRQQAYNDVLVRQGHAFISLDYCGLEVVTITDVDAIEQVAWLDPWDCNAPDNLWFNSGGHMNELFLDESRGMVWVSAGDAELVAIDISDPSNPEIAATVGASGNNRGAYGLGARGGFEAQVFITYITAVVPFQGRVAEVVALRPR